MATSNVRARVSTPADLDAIVATMTTAFFDDPLWGPAFPDPAFRAEQASAFWRLFVTSAQRYPWLLVAEVAALPTPALPSPAPPTIASPPTVASAALWIPPGGSDLTEQELTGFEQFLVDCCGRPVADGILAIFERFEEHHPSEPHFYLSLLATHRDRRGAGSGMSLLRENLARIDALGAPAYLESCNPVNNERYRGVGFAECGQFAVPSGHLVTTMWRPGRESR